MNYRVVRRNSKKSVKTATDAFWKHYRVDLTERYGTLTSIGFKFSCFFQYCSGEPTASHKIYRNKISMLSRISKKRYFHKYSVQENFSNAKKIWEGNNSLLGRENKARKDITVLKCPKTNQISHNPFDFPDIINKYFSSIGYNFF